MTYETLDSGKRQEYASGMVRDSQDEKPRFDLLFPIGVPFSEQMQTRFANLMERGAVKYDERNWEKARGEKELRRYHSSALRHLIQWMTGETDEDHAAAVMFNILAGETVAYKLRASAPEMAVFDDAPELYGDSRTGFWCPLHSRYEHLRDWTKDHDEQTSRDTGPEMC